MVIRLYLSLTEQRVKLHVPEIWQMAMENEATSYINSMNNHKRVKADKLKYMIQTSLYIHLTPQAQVYLSIVVVYFACILPI